jgi:Flp pilus assembly protein TadG
MNRARRSGRRGSRAQSMVELAIVAPILLLLIVGSAQLGAILYSGVSVATAAQEGARVASEQPIKSGAYEVAGGVVTVGSGATCPSSANPVCAAVAQSKGLLGSVTTTIAPGTTPGSGTSCPPKSVGDGHITVTVAADVPIFIPILNNLLASSPGSTKRNVSSTVTVRVETCTMTNGS